MIYKGYMAAMLTFTWLLLAYVGSLVIEYEKSRVVALVEYDCYSIDPPTIEEYPLPKTEET